MVIKTALSEFFNVAKSRYFAAVLIKLKEFSTHMQSMFYIPHLKKKSTVLKDESHL
jgi:hypothetical protein